MSRFEFKLPDIGEGVSEGEIVGWLVHVGDAVSENQDMVEVMTDKATVTIGAPKPGKVVEIRGGEGDVVPVGTVLVVLDVAGDSMPASGAKSAERSSHANAKPAPANAAEPSPAQAPPVVASAVGDIKDDLPGMPKAGREIESDYRNDRPLASPATRKLARERGIDLRRVRPTGDGGRVTREDVERFGGNGQAAAAPTENRPGPARAESAGQAETALAQKPQEAKVPVAPAEGETRVPIRGLRKRIYENMARAKHTAAHFTYVDECDTTELMRMREAAKASAAQSGVQLTYLPFIVKAVVAALKRHPALNCLVDDAAMEMVLRGSYDIGIAVATDAGLTVPVLRRADELTILEAAREIERLSSEARAGKTRREDLGGSSFTITSLGKAGGLFATPVVNYPEVAILGVHQMKRKPVIRGDQIVPGHVMLLSLSFDHRIIDGHVGAAFAQEVIGFLEAPERLLLEMR
jgi:pyruvate dehydrogenase E2 component (dihydrolipoamide acetyltransferase)